MNPFHIGFDRTSLEPARIELAPDTLLRHMMALGSSGSGKTVLCKVLTEEFLNGGLPAICIDPQGDLCSLALHADNPELLIEKGLDPEVAHAFSKRIDPVIFTPASRKGIALSADPMAINVDDLKARDRVYAISSIATMIVSLLGYDLDSDDGAGLVAVFDKALAQLQKLRRFPRNLEQFTEYLLRMDDGDKEEFGRYLDPKKIDHACQKLARLDVGARRLLFHEGLALDIELLLGHGPDAAPVEGKTRLSIIYLNTLHSQEDKEFFVAALTERLYNWMLRNPTKQPQAMFYIDEVAPFIPPVRKPACKPALSLLFKQARKYGVCCLMATQNPADVDYKAMAQFGTWALGRLTTRQDMKKVQPTVKSLDPVNVDAIMAELPSQKPGQFILISPDNFEQTLRLQCRWLYTKHETLDDEKIEALMDETLVRFEPQFDEDGVPLPPDPQPTVRERFDELEQRLESTRPDEPKPAPEKVAAAKAVPVAKPKVQARALADEAPEVDEELEEADKQLARFSSVSVKEFSARAKLSDGKARSRLKKLVAAERARVWKEGREQRYWSVSTKLRPDLGLDSSVKVITSQIASNDVERISREHRDSKLLGLFGDDERLDWDKTKLEHRLVMQLSFTEKVTRMFFKRIFGPSHDEMRDTVYFHPKSLKLVVFSPEDGLRLEDIPDEHASKIEDFDNFAEHVKFEGKQPGELHLRESDITGRKDDSTIKKVFKERFNASPKSVKPVFLPVWNLHLKSSGRGGHRIITIDAISGNQLVGW